MFSFFVCIFLLVAIIIGVITFGFYFLIKIPLALALFTLGIILCCTIIGIPLGIACFKGAWELIIPG